MPHYWDQSGIAAGAVLIDATSTTSRQF